MKRVSLLLISFLLLIVPLQVSAGTIGGKDDPGGVPGQWYVGDTPSYIDPNKAPVVFVHGFNSSSRTWWESNDMYQVALQNGYETAFVDVHPDKNMWDNGILLASKLQEIYNYFGQKKLVVVAHSKGGIDTQNALIHQNAHPYVSNLITLSTPHYGSELADLAYSSWAGWLAGIFGGRNDATYSLQTGYMSQYRVQTDGHANRSRNPIYTFGGTSWGSFGSSLYWGGLYLSSYGQNDGAVTVRSSRLPYSHEVRVSNWNHSSIREGRNTFHLFRPYLASSQPSSFFSAYNEVSASSENLDIEPIHPATNMILRGGEYNRNKKEHFVVENGTNHLSLDWLSDQKHQQLQIVSPSGKLYSNFAIYENDNIFKGAYHHTVTIDQPEAGKWTVLANETKAAYLMTVSIDSNVNDSLTFDYENLQVNRGKNIKVLEMTVHLNNNGIQTTHSKKTMAQKEKLPITLSKAGVYNITIDFKGKTANGDDFERTVVKSVYVDEKGNVIK
ncbi:esterase/lipase family protein [Sutcliffiella cohnii]